MLSLFNTFKHYKLSRLSEMPIYSLGENTHEFLNVRSQKTMFQTLPMSCTFNLVHWQKTGTKINLFLFTHQSLSRYWLFILSVSYALKNLWSICKGGGNLDDVFLFGPKKFVNPKFFWAKSIGDQFFFGPNVFLG